MQDYKAEITVTWNFQATDEEQADERGNMIEEALTLRFKTSAGKRKPSPGWLGNMEDLEVRVMEG